MKTFSLLLVLLSISANAGQAPDFTATVSAGKVVAKAPAHYHFNTKAPIALLVGDHSLALKPRKLSEQLIEFKVSGESPTALSAFLCDDNLTFCEKHVVSIGTGASSEVLGEVSGEAPGEASKTASKTGKIKIDENGFIDNQPDQAFEQAQKEGKPLLIDFYGIWCPPCNELNEQVFNQSYFQKQMVDFVKLKLDSDAPISWKLKARYKIGGYPTLIFATSSGDEISRVVGFRDQSELVKSAHQAYELRAISFDQLKVFADKGDRSASDRLGQIYFDREDWDQAIHYLEGSKDRRENYLEAQFNKSKGDPKNYEKAAQAYLKEFGNFPDSLDVRDHLASYYEDSKQPEKKKEVLKDELETTKYLIKHPDLLTGYDYTPADVYSTQADVYEALGQMDLSKQSWRFAATEYLKRQPSQRERGYNLELGYALHKAGDVEAAEKLYRQLEGFYPKEFTFYYAHASMEYDLKHFPEAQKLAQQAYHFGYGDNKLRAAQVLAKSMKANGKSSDAKALVAKVLKDTSAPDDPQNRTHRYLKSLQDLQASL